MNDAGGFPLIREVRLAPPTRRRLFRWRDPAGLPEVPAGARLLLRTGDRYQLAPPETLDGYAEELLEAESAAVVDGRARRVTARLALSTVEQAYDYTVVVAFRVVVTDPCIVCRSGLRDVGSLLKEHLAGNERVAAFQDRFSIDDPATARAEIRARVIAELGQRPPRIAGLEVRFLDSAVEAPPEAREHRTDMQGRVWQAEKDHFDRGEEDARMAHERKYRSPEELDQLAVTRGELTTAAAAERAQARRDTVMDLYRTEVEAMRARGEIDRDALDRRAVMEGWDRYLLGDRGGPSTRDPSVERRRTRREELETPRIIPPVDDDD